jgi:phage-related protein
MIRTTRPISWIRAARKAFEEFPVQAQTVCLTALTIAAENGKADIAKPLKGLGSGIFEIALPYRGNAFRVVYAVQIADEIWVLHAFQKKSTQGIKTPQHEIELIKSRLKQLKEMFG